jgi:hypothetical protein
MECKGLPNQQDLILTVHALHIKGLVRLSQE